MTDREMYLPLRDLPAVIEESVRAHELIEGDVLFTLVRDPEGDQEVVAIERIGLPAELEDDETASRIVYQAMQRLPIPEQDDRGIFHRVVTIIVRRGRAQFADHEIAWMLAFRYSNHHLAAFDGHIVTITEHGWYEWYSDTAGARPRLVLPA